MKCLFLWTNQWNFGNQDTIVMSQPNLFTEQDLAGINKVASYFFRNERRFKSLEKTHNKSQDSLKRIIGLRLFDQIKHLYFKTKSPEGSKHYLAGCILKPVDVVVSLESPENIAIFIKVETVELGPNSYKSDLGRIWQEIPENLIPVDYEPA